jgi:hypothetical protein
VGVRVSQGDAKGDRSDSPPAFSIHSCTAQLAQLPDQRQRNAGVGDRSRSYNKVRQGSDRGLAQHTEPPPIDTRYVQQRVGAGKVDSITYVTDVASFGRSDSAVKWMTEYTV